MKTSFTFLLSVLALVFTSSAVAQSSNPITIENAKPGTPGWGLTTPSMYREIEGYASKTSVRRDSSNAADRTIDFYVNVKDPGSYPNFTLEVFRMGWYQGIGARQVFAPLNPITSQTQPMPAMDANGMFDCNWTLSYQLVVPLNDSNWATGVYLARLTAIPKPSAPPSRFQSWIIFVVRDDTAPADFLFQSSVTTYQAYNNWPSPGAPPSPGAGKSFYPSNSSNVVQAKRVSFNRPYAIRSEFVGGNLDIDPQAAPGVGAGEFLTNLTGPWITTARGWEYDMVRFLEEGGYNVKYATNIDMHQLTMQNVKAILSVGHDEYWTTEMRDNFEAARANGVNLGFFSANTAYTRIELGPDVQGRPARTMASFAAFRCKTPPRPENPLLGVMFLGGYPGYGRPPLYSGDMVIASECTWVCSGARVPSAAQLPGLLGHEVDQILDTTDTYMCGDQQLASPFTPNRVAHSSYMSLNTNETKEHDATWYIYPASGALVFAGGSVQWSWGLDDFNASMSTPTPFVNSALQQMTRNVLEALKVNTATTNTLLIADTAVTRPPSGSRNAVFKVQLVKPVTAAVSINYATANGSAVAGSDYTAVSGTLNFAAGGPLEKTISVPVMAGAQTGAPKSFSLALSNPINTVVADVDSRAQATIYVSSLTRDLSGDGTMDLILHNQAPDQDPATSDELLAWFMDGARRFAVVPLTGGVTNPSWQLVGVADFNADGKLDLLWRHDQSGLNQVWYMNGTQVTGTAPIATVPSGWTVAGVADFNADGKPDLLWRHQQSGINYVWYMNGVVANGTIQLTTVPSNWVVAGVADFNSNGQPVESNGKPDLLWRNNAGQNQVWYLNGITTVSAAAIDSRDPAWETTGVGDMNQDGQPDILWKSPSGALEVWYMNGVLYVETASLVPGSVPGPSWRVVPR